jgi:hypothetical protein
MKQWEAFQKRIAESKNAEEVTKWIRTAETLALDWNSHHLPEMVEAYRANDPTALRASIYGLDNFMNSEA